MAFREPTRWQKFKYQWNEWSSLTGSFIGLISLIGALLAIPAVLIYGWVHNIILLVTMTSPQITEHLTLFIARIVGIPFIPLGVVLGFV